MVEEFCPECGAKITGSTGFCPECGAVTTSLNNQIKETKRLEREERERRAEHNRQVREKRLNFIKKNKYYIVGLLILIISVAVVSHIIISSDTSNRVYSCDEFTVEYPHNYSQRDISEYFKEANVMRDGVEFSDESGYAFIHIFHFDSKGMSLDDYLNYAKKELDDITSDHWFYKLSSVEKINIGGVEGYKLIEKGTTSYDNRTDECIIFIKDNECYWIWFEFIVDEEYKNIVSDSFKFN